MEQNPTAGSSKWSLAAKDGLILAAVTVVISTLTFLTKNSFLNGLLWLVKLVGSIWLLRVIMQRYGKAHPDESTFSYGAIVCVLSAVVCAVWSFDDDVLQGGWRGRIHIRHHHAVFCRLCQFTEGVVAHDAVVPET